jgi:hypothetical protein
MLRMFGLGEGPTWDGGIGWGDVQEEGGGGDVSRFFSIFVFIMLIMIISDFDPARDYLDAIFESTIDFQR